MRAQRLPRRGALPNTAALFPLRCFLSPSLSEFNEDNEVSQAHFALQQLSNTSLTREKGPKRPGAQGRSSPAETRSPGAGAGAPGAEPGCGDSAPSSPSPALRCGSIIKKNPNQLRDLSSAERARVPPWCPEEQRGCGEAVAAGTAVGSSRDRPRGSL